MNGTRRRFSCWRTSLSANRIPLRRDMRQLSAFVPCGLDLQDAPPTCYLTMSEVCGPGIDEVPAADQDQGAGRASRAAVSAAYRPQATASGPQLYRPAA